MAEIELGVTADLHVHLRDGPMMELITPTVKQGGVSIAYVMPNLVPPVTTIERVSKYREDLEKLCPDTRFLMTFYLSKELTEDLVAGAASKGYIHGIKCYPAGVTTNSKYGVDPNDFTSFYPIFRVMEKEGLILNIHGEKPGIKNESADENEDIHVLNAEPKFLPALRKLHEDFPKLKIVLEHCTTRDAIELIRDLNKGTGPQDEVYVAGTITAHHLSLTIDNWAGNPINFCKPVAKFPRDMRALVDAATSGERWFFFGSDSAPHPIEAKSTHVGVCAGVYTQSHAISYVAEVFDQQGKLENISKFVGSNGISFYGLKNVAKTDERAWLVQRENTVPEVIANNQGLKVVPFKAGEKLNWTVEWR
ncbi:Dihydroorotase [Suhomyces tanzawaensis NRRL Y-17324]|uniref:Dihydroorotase n=1 Tax=Suhomyces tanzawaensis NRRL Y-17324 TaxID=984487 RepID=A0A1E4SRX3_9ASCO|nr:Dihydroorotase [Suhomyces tanzawaensis NRRL Y-17324]ODV82260.1 Dihydroorotase [Suhomyces tanzawaensis NRRL Y-17324]